VDVHEVVHGRDSDSVSVWDHVYASVHVVLNANANANANAPVDDRVDVDLLVPRGRRTSAYPSRPPSRSRRIRPHSSAGIASQASTTRGSNCTPANLRISAWATS
jgi:hypothetical protein